MVVKPRGVTAHTVKLTVCLCVYSSCNCSTVAMRQKLTASTDTFYTDTFYWILILGLASFVEAVTVSSEPLLASHACTKFLFNLWVWGHHWKHLLLKQCLGLTIPFLTDLWHAYNQLLLCLMYICNSANFCAPTSSLRCSYILDYRTGGKCKMLSITPIRYNVIHMYIFARRFSLIISLVVFHATWCTWFSKALANSRNLSHWW